MLLIVAASIVFCGLLFLYFEFTIQGKALRATAVNRVGARLVGIRPTSTGTIAYLLASLLAGISGVLIAPVTTIFYDLGLPARPEGLRRRHHRRHGELSGDGAGRGAWSACWRASPRSGCSAYKEVLVFSLLIPVLLWRSLSFAGMPRRKRPRNDARCSSTSSAAAGVLLLGARRCSARSASR